VTHAVAVDADGRYAGIATRFLAFLIDVGIIAVLFALGGRLLEYLVGVLAGHPVAFSDSSSKAEAALGLWAFLIIAIPLAVTGRTFGMGLVGLRCVTAGGQPIGRARAVVRTLLLPLSFLIFGLGFLLIVLRTDRRALHDLLAGTAVVYARRADARQPKMLVDVG
jgi:uncharacterized RDD family membrane protein YckC